MANSSRSYNIIFAGTPEFSKTTLAALLQSRHSIKAVYTQPDRPAGRGRKLTASSVKVLALQHDLPVYQPITLRDPNEQKILIDLKADLMIVVAYGLLLPLPILQAPVLGCLNIHASLLPRWRGAAPIQRAVLAGDAMTGITIMQMDAGLDTGAMLYKAECPIRFDDTSATLHASLSVHGANALLTTLDQLDALTPQAQDNSAATYAHKISKEEAEINWDASAVELDRKIRAFNPWPVAFTHLGENVLRIWSASVIEQSSSQEKPGTLLRVSSEGFDVATGQAILRLNTLQLPGGRVLSAADLLNSRQTDFAVGKILG